MIKIDRVIVVEGKYDKIKLSSIVDGVIVETGGFDIFSDKEKQKLLRMLAQKKGLLVLTDSDVAGFRIRHFISCLVPKDQVIHAYIPDLYGKEKRKEKASKEGKLGVEGVPVEVILSAFQQAGAICTQTKQPSQKITKMDLFDDGLSGRADSSARREVLQKKLNLPEHLTTNSLLDLLNAMVTYEEYKELIHSIFD